MTYSVWNPITKQLCRLPQPQQYYKSLCIAFFSVTEECFDDIIHYKVIRARCDCRRDEVNTVSIETFSSVTDGKISQDYDECVLGEAPDGLLQYGQSSTSGMEIWVLAREGDSFSSTCNHRTGGI
ncbi:F-box protein [Prunus yedoensis var. nudiflora]|uniref:F-box protein n=1 Tax=Prunus yedoensis var. nudiflora TaxID=2094558 RepID=A0A314XNR6_PRUYE|nr:F-box protein [Prunus yedoensis var. nudiflora]